MSVFQEVRAVSSGMETDELLRHLLVERFPGKTIVTASLRARSVVTLKMVADIAPDTPVVFCHPSALFEESRAYREKLVALLGLTNVTETRGQGHQDAPSDKDHFECMWVQDPQGGGMIHETVHLNDTLAGYDCWISAVYHTPKQPQARNRVDVDAGIIRVDPLIKWSDAEVKAFMAEHSLPYHPRATGLPTDGRVAPEDGEQAAIYCY